MNDTDGTPDPRLKPRRSACMAAAQAAERTRIQKLSVEERIQEALGMSQRFSKLQPVDQREKR